MSECIYYGGDLEGVKTEEWEEVLEHIFKFQEAQLVTENKKNGYISFHVEDGWRGGGYSCEELIKEHFEDFCKSHPHINLRITAQYVEHAPIEEFKFKGEQFETGMIC
jgi:hypothetical protein